MSEPFGPEVFRPLFSGLHHPEGLVWDDDQELIYAGGEGGEIYRGSLDGSWEQIADCGEGGFVLGLAVDARGDLYVCDRGNSRVIKLDADDLSTIELSRGTTERPMHCPNYPAFDASGRLFVSDSGSWGEDDGVIFVIDPERGTSVWATAPSDFTNGLALSPDARFLYAAESRASRVWRIAIEPDGTAGEQQIVWHFPATVPDGLAFDSAGRLYVSCYTPDSIYVVEPDGEQRLFAHDWSGQFLQAPTNLAFLGKGLTSLAHANLCGWHLGVTDAVPSPGHPVARPEVASWLR